MDLNTPLDALALSSLDRIQLLMELEQKTGNAVSEAQFAGARSVGDLMRAQPAAVPDEPIDFPEWNRGNSARAGGVRAGHPKSQGKNAHKVRQQKPSRRLRLGVQSRPCMY